MLTCSEYNFFGQQPNYQKQSIEVKILALTNTSWQAPGTGTYTVILDMSASNGGYTFKIQ